MTCFSNHFRAQPTRQLDACSQRDSTFTWIHPYGCHYIASTSSCTLYQEWIAMLNTCEKDSFYKQHTPEELELAFANKYDFDHPDALDMTLFASVGDPLRWDNTIIKQYHPIVHCRPQERASNKHSGILFFSAPTTEERRYLYGASIIIGESIRCLLFDTGRDAHRTVKPRALWHSKIQHFDNSMIWR